MIRWYQKNIEEIFKDLKTSERGLTDAKVKSVKEKFGLNEISEANPIKWWHIFFAQFANIMVLILIFGAVISFMLDEKIDAYAILTIVVINTIIGFTQEFKAEKAIDALKELAAPDAIVVRGGETFHIEAKDLVPGDIIVLEEGMYVPADARIIESAELNCLESSLTGESTPVQKTENVIKKDVSVGDMNNMVFMGTTVAKGHGTAVVVNTGMKTYFGSIANLVQNERNVETPLQKRLDHLSKVLAVVILGLIGVLFGISFFTGRDLLEMFILSISLAVSVIPEGLPAVITLTLAIGVQKMAKDNAIIRKLAAAETLGSTNYICTDKTGTLTQNQMTVQRIFTNGEDIQVTGIGYEPNGEIKGDLQNEELRLLLDIGALCNNSRLLQNNEWEVIGDPTEGCLLTLAKKAGIDVHNLHKDFQRTYENVFDSERKRMSTVHEREVMYMKGAVDSVLDVCKYIQLGGEVIKLTDKIRKELLEKNAEYASEAYRVLGFAYRKGLEAENYSEKDMIFVGMVGMIDPPRPEVKEAIKTCKDAHISVVMITGDHAMTAKAIGSAIGLYEEGEKILTGNDLNQMSEAELIDTIDDVSIFARVNPAHKVKILKAIQSKKNIVAMTGDGVNDSPALKAADIGIAMGITGTDVAQESSDMILTDDNFATIVKTIESGRQIYTNIKKFIAYSLSANFDEVFLVTIAFLMGMPLPFVPLQVLWINLMTDSLPGIALGIDKPSKGIMKLKPRLHSSGIIKEILAFSVFAGVISAVVSIAVYFMFVNNSSIEYTRTIVITTIVVFELMLAFSVRDEYGSSFKDMFNNWLIWFAVILASILQLAVIYVPWFQNIFDTVAIKAEDWIYVIGAPLVAIIIIEVWKLTRKRPDHV